MSAQFHWNPETYLELIREEVPLFEQLQDETIAGIPFPPKRVLELGVGTGETARRLLAAHPDAEILGLDASPEMVFHARGLGIEVQLARIEDPLPDGPWDLVVAVLSIHHLPADGKRDLFRRVREQSRSLVIGDVVKAEQQRTPIDPDYDFPEEADDLASACDGEIVWQDGDLVVIAATYD